jgi:hypothetical protein
LRSVVSEFGGETWCSMIRFHDSQSGGGGNLNEKKERGREGGANKNLQISTLSGKTNRR